MTSKHVINASFPKKIFVIYLTKYFIPPNNLILSQRQIISFEVIFSEKAYNVKLKGF